MASYLSNGTLFKKGDGATPTEVFATIAQVISITPPVFERGVVETRVMGQDYPVVLAGPVNAQTVELKVLFDSADAMHQAFRTDFIAKTVRNYQIVLPDVGAELTTIAAFVSKYGQDELTAEGAEIVASVTLQATSVCTVTP
jgi:hypothetical protein